MDIKIIPGKLNGTVSIPSSKSMTHRVLIGAALAKGKSVISNVTFSKDIYATIDALKASGADITAVGNTVTVNGLCGRCPQNAEIDCCESGSTLRFMIPVTAALGINSVYKGQGRLPERPITPYLRELPQKGITFDYENTMPFTVSGKLLSGKYSLEGNISSQFITGLLFALPLLEGDSEIILTSPLESKPYADMTIESLKLFGIDIKETQKGYYIKGSQQYHSSDVSVEGDYSQAAFFYVANALGSNVKIENKIEFKETKKLKLIELKNIVFNRSRAKGYFLSGFILLFTSLFYPYGLYYQIFASILFCLSLFSFYNKKYNVKPSDNLFE